MRGQFTNAAANHEARATADAPEPEWCERRLLARINRYNHPHAACAGRTGGERGLHALPARMAGRDARTARRRSQSVAAVLEQLEGFEVPAIAWERDVLPARLAALTTRPGSTRCACRAACCGHGLMHPRALSPGQCAARPSRCCHACTCRCGAASRSASAANSRCLHRPRAIAEQLHARGASFFDELMRGSGLLQAQAESALGELVAAGLVSADSFGGLRALLLPLERKRKLAARGRRTALFGLEEAGRWSLLQSGRRGGRSLHRSRTGGADRLATAAAVTASCSAASSRARRRGCRHGMHCCA